MKERPGQNMLIIFFYFNYMIICVFLLFGTWCFFYQSDANAWLEARFSDKATWDKDFNGESLSSMQAYT
jgi:hypothetical protein